MMPVQESELLEFRSLVAQRLGLWFDEHRREFLAGVLRERVGSQAGGNGAVGRYLHALSTAESPGEWAALAGALSVTETYFFRGQEHFQAFAETVLPDRCRHKGAAPRLRLLSAGCASGEEAYTLAIVLREHAPALAEGRIEIVGVDANREMLAKARRGIYSAWSLRETPSDILEKYFRQSQQEFTLDAGIREMVTFEERNLAAPNQDFWTPGAFDAVFCRNMLMYFTPAAATALIVRIEQALAPGGFLFLGHAETLRGLSQAFHLRHSHGAFYYQLRKGAESAQPVTTAWTAGDREPVSPASYAPAATSTVWFDEIGRASARIAALTSSPPAAATTATPAAAMPVRKRPAGLDRILILHRQERFTEALAQLQDLSARDSGDSDLQVLQAVLLVNCGRFDEAESLCRPLLGRDDLNAGAHHVLALCREHVGDLAAAEEHNAAAAYLDPHFAMPRFHLGLICKRQDRASDALAHFQGALDLLAKEDPVRLLLFGGGFPRETLLQACRGEILRLGGSPAS